MTSRKRCIALVSTLLVLLGMLGIPALAQQVRAVVVNEFANLRVVPAIGAEVIGTVAAGYEFTEITARSGDGEWIRVNYFGNEAWVNLAPLRVLSGDVAALPVADPRTIPYGGFESPRAGSSDVTGPVAARATNGVRLRAGPSTGYPTLANIFYNEAVSLTGRTASNNWYQVNYEGTLGWAAAQFFEILGGDVYSLPVDGIVASSPPLSTEGEQDFIALIGLMLARVNITQESLNQIRASWTDAALTGRAQCSRYPARPSDINIATPLLAAFYITLNPLQSDFNDAMANLRLAIDLFIQVCNQPGTGNPVGQATVSGALNAVNTAEQQFASLRERLTALLPSQTPGANECLISFRGRAEILPVINLGTIYLDEFTRRKNVVGYCVDVLQGQTLNAQIINLPNSNLAFFFSISPLDNPTGFLTVNQTGRGQRLVVGPISISSTTRYLIIIADLGSDGGLPIGKFAFRLADITFASVIPLLEYDPETRSVILNTNPDALFAAGLGPAPTPDLPGLDPNATPGPISGGETPGVVCPSPAFSCSQLFTCGEAQACLAAGNFSLDQNGDGIPCGPGDAGPVLCNP